MTTANTNLTFEQVLNAIRQLPYVQKVKLWRTLNNEVNRDETRRRAAEAIEAIRAANEGVTEDEVMADATAAVKEVRAERRARNALSML
jgi:hypothetical protein